MRIVALALGATCLASCSFVDRWEGRAISSAGAGVILDEGLRPYDERNLIALIETSTGQTKNADSGGRVAPATETGSEQALAASLGGFTNLLYVGTAANGDGPPKEPTVTEQNRLRDARNQIQGALMTRSGNMCNAFKQRLRFQSSTIAFGLGTAAVLFGSAGAILTGTASQALAAAAGAATGTQAEYDRDFLSGLTTSVIIPGIDRQRSAIQQEIVDRRCLGVSSYTLSQALLDVTRFHAACSTDVGVAVAGSAISQSRTTSLEVARAAIDAVVALQTSAKAIGADGSGSGAGTATKPVDPKLPGPPPLVGDPIKFLQCPSLQANGTLPPDVDAGEDGASIQPRTQRTTLSRSQAGSSGSVGASTVVAPLRLKGLSSPFRGQTPYGIE